MAEMSGGCFTLSSLGHIGGTGFTPIINAPEVAILGICRAQDRFLPDAEGKPVLRQLLPLSLSYDHRVINGADAARFVRAIGEWLEGRGRLHQSIRSLTMPELEAMAQNAISRFIVLASQRISEAPGEPESQKLSTLLMG